MFSLILAEHKTEFPQLEFRDGANDGRPWSKPLPGFLVKRIELACADTSQLISQLQKCTIVHKLFGVVRGLWHRCRTCGYGAATLQWPAAASALAATAAPVASRAAFAEWLVPVPRPRRLARDAG